MTLSECWGKYRNSEISKTEYIQSMHDSHRRLFEYSSFLQGSGIERIEILPGELQIVCAGGVRFAIDPDDLRQPPLEELHFRGFEADEWETFRRLIQPDMTVFDIGANIGWYTVKIGALLPSVRLHAFEPVPDTYRTIWKNVELNRLGNVTLHPFGLSDREGEAEFHFSPASTVAASAANILDLPESARVKVALRTLDSFCAESGLSPDFIKCDVEGGELRVLQGGRETLAKARPILFLEMLRKWSAKFGYHPNEIIDLMIALGYRCFEQAATGLGPFSRMTEATRSTNFIFLHNDRHSEIIRNIAAE